MYVPEYHQADEQYEQYPIPEPNEHIGLLVDNIQRQYAEGIVRLQ